MFRGPTQSAEFIRKVIYISLIGANLFINLKPAEGAEVIKTRWEINLGGGLSFLNGKIAENTVGEEGPIFRGGVSYSLIDTDPNLPYITIISFGLGLEQEKHKIKFKSEGLEGDLTTNSVIPFVEFRYKYKRLAFYIAPAIVLNYNLFKYDHLSQNICLQTLGSSCELNIVNTASIRFDIGFDYWITKVLAISVETGWKGNETEAHKIVNGATVRSESFNLDSIPVLVGLRYYF